MPCPLSACLRYWPYRLTLAIPRKQAGPGWPLAVTQSGLLWPAISHTEGIEHSMPVLRGAQEREALREHRSVTGFSCILLPDLMWTLLDLRDADVTRSCECWGLSGSYPEQRRRHHLLGLCSKAMKEKRPPCSVLPLECAWQHFYVSRRGGNAFTFLIRNADPGFPRYLRKRSLGS